MVKLASPFALPQGFTLLQVTPEMNTGGVEQTTLDVAAAVVAGRGRSIVATRGGRLEGRLAGEGSLVAHMPVHAKNPLTIAANIFRLAALVRAQNVDLIHVRSRAPAFSAMAAARLTGRPIVSTYHGVYNARSGVKRWYNAMMTRGDRVIANSGFTRDHVLAEHGIDPAKVVAIARGVDLARFDPAAVSAERLDGLAQSWGLKPDDSRVKVLLAGRLTRWKGQGLLIDAAARLKARGVGNFILILAGDDQGRTAYRESLAAQIRAAGLEDQVRLVGHCADMPAAYVLADIAAAPSLDPEAFGRTAVEPQVMGRPVLAADHGAARETVVDGETGWLVKPSVPQAWEAALERAVLMPSAERRRMGEAARARATRLYSVAAMTQATLAVYAEVLSSRRA